MLNSPKSRPPLLWMQVSGLAAVQGAISLVWIAYNLYIPQFLAQFGFPKEVAAGLLIVENLLALVLEPVFGSLSDRAQRWVGSRFPFIAAGVVLSAALFVCLPAIAFFGASLSAVSWVLPAAAIAWALAMTVFRSPSLALLGRYSPVAELPKAASILTLVGAVIGAIAPQVNPLILRWGPTPTFVLGSIVLLVSATVLRMVDQRVPPKPIPSEPNPPLAIAPLAIIFAVGITTSIGFGLVRSLMTLREVIVVFSIANIFLVIPAGLLAVKLGNRRAMLVGIVSIVLLAGLLGLIPTASIAFAIAVLLSGAFSLVANGLLPLALTTFPAAQAGLAVGIYLGGTALANTLSSALKLSSHTPQVTAIVITIAFLVAAYCVTFTTQKVSPAPPN